MTKTKPKPGPMKFEWWAVVQDNNHLCVVFRKRSEAKDWIDEFGDNELEILGLKRPDLKIERVTVARGIWGLV